MFKIENIQIILLLKIFFVLLKLNLLDQNNYLFHSKINNKQLEHIINEVKILTFIKHPYIVRIKKNLTKYNIKNKKNRYQLMV